MRALKPGFGRASLVGTWVVILCLGAAGTLDAQSEFEDEVSAQLITLDADSTQVATVLEVLAERTGLNIVTAPEVQGRVISIHLRNTPFLEALNLVVRASGLGYERVGNSILVADPQRLATQTGLTSRVYHLQYASVEEVSRAVEVVSREVRAFASGNRLIVKAPQSVIEEIEVVVADIDVPPRQVMLEIRLVEVYTDNLKELGIDWERLMRYGTTITEGELDDAPKGQLPQDIPSIPLDKTTDFYRQNIAIEVALDLLITDSNAKILANPKVTTLDNQPAEIFIGETVPVVITSLQSGGVQGGAFQTVELKEIDVGVKLEVLPRISDDGYITTVVTPEVSRIIAFVGPDNDLPATAKRRATSVVRVKDGEKFYLGGLLAEENTETIKKVPLLGDIPILGYLFRHYRSQVKNTDLVIEVTPTIISEEE